MKNFFVEKVRIVDIIIVLGVIAALTVGFFTYKHFRQTADKQIEKTAKVAFQVFLRGVTITSGVNPIKTGDTTFISIRNVPYTNLKIVDSKIDTKKTIMPNPAGKPPFILVEDFSQVFMYDVVVTVIDTAQITKDGVVVGGNKIKIGLPITLEGKDYKFNGSVSNVQILPEASEKSKTPAKEQSNNVKLNAPINNAPAKPGAQPTPPVQATAPTGNQPRPQAPAKK